MRSILAVLIVCLFAVSAVAQSEKEVKSFFEGTRVTLRIDMPDASEGVVVYPERTQPLDYKEYRRLIRRGVAIPRSSAATLNEIRVKDNNIEVGFVDDQHHVSRFNIHFARFEDWMLTPATVFHALNRYIAFSEPEKLAAELRSVESAGGFVRKGVVQLGPRSTYLREGLKLQEVLKVLGEPSLVSERAENWGLITTYEFQRGKGKVLVAEFMGGALVQSRTEMRAAGSVSAVRPVESLGSATVPMAVFQ